MKAKIIFSDAPYCSKYSLKILGRLLVICVFYRPECAQFLVFFFHFNGYIQ